jgi:hypothetical protein
MDGLNFANLNLTKYMDYYQALLTKFGEFSKSNKNLH